MVLTPESDAYIHGWLDEYESALERAGVDQADQQSFLDAALVYGLWWEIEGPGATDGGQYAPAYLTPATLEFLAFQMRERHGFDHRAICFLMRCLAPLVLWAEESGHVVAGVTPLSDLLSAFGPI
ncbi:MAG TPA: hypothetical protein VGK74_29345 [Symbiobacteriaceae bacterium]